MPNNQMPNVHQRSQAERQALAARLLANPSRLYTLAEAADLYGCSAAYLAKLIHKQQIGAWRDDQISRGGGSEKFRWLLQADTLAQLVLRPHQPARTPVPTLEEMRARHATKTVEARP